VEASGGSYGTGKCLSDGKNLSEHANDTTKLTESMRKAQGLADREIDLYTSRHVETTIEV
jgi:hypothetical protein